jgi:N utilization substance protein B
MRRSDQRRDAVFACYQRDLTGRPLTELIGDRAKPFTRELAEGVEEHRRELDGEIARHAKGWSVERIAPLDRNIMRIASYELLREPGTPSAVIIDEAVELAKRFGEADSPAFVNGVLDAVRRAVRDKETGGASPSE